MHAYKRWRRQWIAPVLWQWCLQSQQCKYRCRSLYSASPRWCCSVKCHMQRTHFHNCHFAMNHYDYMNYVAQKASPQCLSYQQITHTQWHKPTYTTKVCHMGTTCILLQFSLYVAVTTLTLMAFTVISEDIPFISCIHWQTFQSVWPQKTWQE